MKLSLKHLAACTLSSLCLATPINALAWSNHIDCEGGTLGAKVATGTTNAFTGTFTNTVYSNTQAAFGTQSCKMSITQGTDGWGTFGAAYTFPSKLYKGAQVWTRLSLFVPTGFNLTTNTGMLKFMRVHTASSAGANEGYHDLLFTVPGTTFWTAGTGNWTAPYINNYEGKPGNAGVGATPTNNVAFGKWESYEIYVKLDSVSKDAGGTGEIKIWKNNTLLLDRTNINTLVSSTSYADLFYLFTYWNGTAPATQSLYVDDITITSDTPSNRDASGFPFVGGAASGAAAATSSSPALPSAPSGVTVTQ